VTGATACHCNSSNIHAAHNRLDFFASVLCFIQPTYKTLLHSVHVHTDREMDRFTDSERLAIYF